MECRNKATALSVGIILTDDIIPRSGGRQDIAFRHPQLQSTLFEDFIGSEQEAFMTRLRNDSLLPRTVPSTELLVHHLGPTLPVRDSIEEHVSPSTFQDQNSLQPVESISYEVSLKPSQLLKDALLERILIGQQLKSGLITEDNMKDYASNMPIHLLHGGPGNGKSFAVTRIRDMAQSLDLDSLVMAFSGTAASQFKNNT